jgi:hypothetical protein
MYAADIKTDEGDLKLVFASDNMFLHLFTPDKPVNRNNDNTSGIFPAGQISFLSAITPIGTKFHKASEMGPQSGRNIVVSANHSEPVKGKVFLKYVP